MYEEKIINTEKELNRDLLPEEMLEVLSDIPKITEIQALLLTYVDESNQREAEGHNILNLEEETTDKEIIQFLDDLLFTQKGIERQIKNIKSGKYKNDKYKDNKYKDVFKGILKIEKARNEIDESKEYILTHYLELIGEVKRDEVLEDIKDRVKLANITGLLWGTKDRTEKEIKNYSRAYKIYKAKFIKEKIKADTPTIKRTLEVETPRDILTGKIQEVASDYALIENSISDEAPERIIEFYHRKDFETGKILKNAKKIKSSLRGHLTPQDFYIAIDVANLWRRGHTELTIESIYKEVSDNKNARLKNRDDKTYKAIEESLEKLSNIYFETYTEEMQFKSRPRVRFLDWETVYRTNKRGTITDVIKINEEPFMSFVMSKFNQNTLINRVDLEKVGIKRVDENVFILQRALKNFLSRRKSMANGKTSKDDTSLFVNDFFKLLVGIDLTDRKNKNIKYSMIETLEKLLKAHKKEGNIYSYDREYKEDVLSFKIKFKAPGENNKLIKE